MDVLTLSRLQFAAATYFHFLFVPLTLGLSLLIALMETRYVRTKDEEYRTMARFWGKLFLINFAVGVATGITLEFQFGTNWSRYSRYVGDIFGPLLAIEATVAFFLESTFIGVWAFGWKRLSPGAHAVTIWLVALASNVSAVWILIANAWMQNPVGYVMKDGRPVLTDFLAVITQEYAILTILHVLFAAWVVAGFFVMGVSAHHILRTQNLSLFTRSFRMGLSMALVFSILTFAEGHFHGADLALKQPGKLAAMESHWDTGAWAPIYLIALPDDKEGDNRVAIGPIPGALSMLAFHSPSASVKGLKDIPLDERPPVLPTFISFRLMITLGGLFVLLALYGWWRRKRIESERTYLRLLQYVIPLPYLACALGWTVAEVGRQPWIVYGLMRTRDGASPVAAAQVLISFIAFLLVYTVIGTIAVYLMATYARKNPVAEQAGRQHGRRHA